MGARVEKGYESSLYVRTSGTYAAPVWTEIDLARDVTSLDDTASVDVTARRSARIGYEAEDYGLSKVGWELDMLVPAAGETSLAYATLEAARKARATVDILHVEGGIISTDNLSATRVVCGVFGGAKGEPLKDASTRKYRISYINNSDQDAPAFGITSGGEFVEAS